MFKKLLRFLLSHIADNTSFYGICAISLAAGTAAGIAGGRSFDDGGFLSEFFRGLSDFSAKGLFSEGFLQAIILSGVILVFGMSPLGCLMIPLCDAYKGFAFGFSASAVYSVYGIKSALFVILGLIPPAVIWVPAVMFASVNGLRASASLMRMFRRRSQPDLRNDTAGLIVSVIISFLAILISKLVEIYIVPQMLNIVGALYV